MEITKLLNIKIYNTALQETNKSKQQFVNLCMGNLWAWPTSRLIYIVLQKDCEWIVYLECDCIENILVFLVHAVCGFPCAFSLNQRKQTSCAYIKLYDYISSYFKYVHIANTRPILQAFHASVASNEDGQ